MKNLVSNNCVEVEPETSCTNAAATTVTLPCCPSTQPTPSGGTVSTIKVPVVLAEVDVQVGLEADITFSEDVYEIKRIRKNAYINQFEVIVDPILDDCDHYVGKLYIGGYIRKNIEYATNECDNNGNIIGNIKHMTVKTPFKCFTDIAFDNQPIVPLAYQQQETLQLGEKFCGCNKFLTGKNQCKDVLYNQEDFMEKIYCEFVQSRIMEVDLHDVIDGERCSCDEPLGYSGMTEKMGVHLVVKVLQKQQVSYLC